ncbi:MAG: insulinase family protein [Alphaproteobacteria bacterium]|nr:insulinase family protein [Alphaproteobacteria bacterium]
MSTKVSTLGNGLRVVTHLMPQLETVSLGAWVGVGARHDPEPENGIAHFLEHMAFKGTGRRSAKDIAEEIEDVGGDLNAATSLETTAYYARVLKGDEGKALDVLSDILQNSKFDAEELHRERDVILQEIAASQDCPDDVVYDMAQEAAYSGQPLGRSILGTRETVGAISADGLRSYLGTRYTPERMVVSAAGAVEHDEIVKLVEDQFSGLGSAGNARSAGQDETTGNGSASNGAGGVEKATYRGGVRYSTRPFEQCHVILGFEAPAHGQPGYFDAQVLSGLLGGGMSSRLFQEAREKRGLCYSVYSSVWGLSDTGVMMVHGATSPELANELLDVVAAQILRLSEEGPTDREVNRAKAQLKAGLMMGLESSAARAEQMARQLMFHGRLIEKAELIEKVDAVSAENVQLLLKEMIGGVPVATVVGAGENSEGYARRVCETFQKAAD